MFVFSSIQIIKCLIILGIFKHFFEDKHIDFSWLPLSVAFPSTFLKAENLVTMRITFRRRGRHILYVELYYTLFAVSLANYFFLFFGLLSTVLREQWTPSKRFLMSFFPWFWFRKLRNDLKKGRAFKKSYNNKFIREFILFKG